MSEQEVGQNVKHPNKNFVIRVFYQTLYKETSPSINSAFGWKGFNVLCHLYLSFPHFLLSSFTPSLYSVFATVLQQVSALSHKIVHKGLVIHFLLSCNFTSFNIIIYSLFSIVLNLICIFLINVLALTFKFTFVPSECLHLKLNTT